MTRGTDRPRRAALFQVTTLLLAMLASAGCRGVDGLTAASAAVLALVAAAVAVISVRIHHRDLRTAPSGAIAPMSSASHPQVGDRATSRAGSTALSPQRLDALAATGADGWIAIDALGRPIDFDHGARRLLGVEPRVPIVLPGGAWPGPRRAGVPVDVTLEVDGRAIEACAIDAPWHGQEARLVRLRDVTRERRQAEEHALLSEHTTDVVALLRLDGTCRWVSASVARLLGRDPADVVGARATDLVHPDDAMQVRVAFEATTAEGRGRALPPMRLKRSDGGWAWVASAVQPVRDEAGVVREVITTARDVTGRRNVEAQLHQAQKMEAVGTLTGGIAHDFNNILQAVIGNLQLGADQASASPGAKAHLEVALRASLRGAELTQRLLAFARRQPLDPQPHDVNEIVADTIQFIRRTLGANVEIATRLGDHLPLALVDRGQLEAALVNLAINGRDAMPTGGRLLFETGVATLDEAYVTRNPDAIAGRFLLVTVSDTGEGIATELMPRVFEPFFTTKRSGRGSGLGLPMVYGFVRQSGGHVKLYSELGVGTTVRLYLPISAAALAREAVVDDTGVPIGHERVLVVDDDDDVRTWLASVLTGLGYQVTIASTVGEAAERSGELDHLDLLLCDVILRGTGNGPAVAAQVRTRFPDVRVLFVSGWTEDALLRDGEIDPAIDLLAKPFTKETVARRVRRALDIDR